YRRYATATECDRAHYFYSTISVDHAVADRKINWAFCVYRPWLSGAAFCEKQTDNRHRVRTRDCHFRVYRDGRGNEDAIVFLMKLTALEILYEKIYSLNHNYAGSSYRNCLFRKNQYATANPTTARRYSAGTTRCAE